MEDNRSAIGGNAGSVNPRDPFPAEICLSILGTAASIVCVLLSVQERIIRACEKNQLDQVHDLWREAMSLHNALDDLIILVSQSCPDLGGRPFRFRDGGIELSARQLLQYGLVDNRILSIQNRVKELAAGLRNNAFGADHQTTRETLYQLAQPLDELLAGVSSMTYTQFLEKLKDVLKRLESDLVAMAH